VGTGCAVRCRALSKDYGAGNGLFNLDLAINEGETFGIVGPNGAGKSTFIKLLMDLIRPTNGTAEIFGLDAQHDSLELKRVIGYLPGELMQFPGVTAGYILDLLLNLRRISDRKRLHELAQRLELDLDRKYQDLSHGNKQKVGLIQAFMHDPKLLILDEPTLGLDPIIQREVRNIISEFTAAGKTVILSSHIMSEVESICNRIGLINRGRILRVGTLAELRSERMHKMTIVIKGAKPNESELRSSGAVDIVFDGDSITFRMQGYVNPIISLLNKFEVEELDSRELSLEEVFFSEVSGA